MAWRLGSLWYPLFLCQLLPCIQLRSSFSNTTVTLLTNVSYANPLTPHCRGNFELPSRYYGNSPENDVKWTPSLAAASSGSPTHRVCSASSDQCRRFRSGRRAVSGVPEPIGWLVSGRRERGNHTRRVGSGSRRRRGRRGVERRWNGEEELGFWKRKLQVNVFNRTTRAVWTHAAQTLNGLSRLLNCSIAPMSLIITKLPSVIHASADS